MREILELFFLYRMACVVDILTECVNSWAVLSRHLHNTLSESDIISNLYFSKVTLVKLVIVMKKRNVSCFSHSYQFSDSYFNLMN